MAGRDDDHDIDRPPAFRPGDKVTARAAVRNDGTYPGRDVGAILVRKGDVGYVRDIGTFLQRHYVYAVDWVGRGALVGMRGRELAPAPTAAPTAAPARPAASTGEPP